MRRPILALILLCTGCASHAANPELRAERVRDERDLEANRIQAESRLDRQAHAFGTEQQPVPRQIIRRGNIDVAVANVGNSRTRFESAVTSLNAQVARVSLEGVRSANYVIRVPAEQLGALLDSVAALGKVGRRSISAEDVTDRVVDTEARLSALRATRDRLKQLMERSASVADIVAVERELGRVQAELESLEARLKAMRGAVTLSEVHVRIERQIVLGPLGWVAKGVGTVIGKLFVWR